MNEKDPLLNLILASLLFLFALVVLSHMAMLVYLILHPEDAPKFSGHG